MFSPFPGFHTLWRVGWRQASAVCLLAYTCLAGGLQAQDRAAPDAEGTIKRFSDFWANDVRDNVRPIEFEMIVTFYDPTWGNLWCLIDDEAGYLQATRGLPLRSYDRVRVSGTVVPAKGLAAETADFTVLERDVFVEAIEATGHVSDYQRLKSRVVTFEAIVDHEQVTEGDHYQLNLVANGHRVVAYRWDAAPELRGFPEGAIVRVTGVYNERVDPRTETLEVDLWVGRKSDIVLVGSLNTDPRFDTDLSSINGVHYLGLDGRKVARVAGVVRAVVPGESITLRDATGQIMVLCRQSLPLEVGDVIEAVGDPFTRGADWLLRDAIVRRARPELAESTVAALEDSTQIRLADQVLALSPEEAVENRQVDLTGVVMWASPKVDFVFLRDPSGGTRVRVDDVDHELIKTGAGIRVVGVTIPGPYTPEVLATGWEYWGGAVPPMPETVTLAQAMTGSEEGQRIELTGLVTSITQEPEWTRMVLSTSTGEFVALINDDSGPVGDLEGSIVAVNGICRAVANARRQLSGIEVWVPNAGEIRVKQWAPANPFDVPFRRISALRQFNAGSQASYWAKVQGTVIHHRPGRSLFVQDEADGLLVFTEGDGSVLPGDVVEVGGLPGFESQRLVMREASFRRIASGPEPEPVHIEEPRLIREEWESRLVRIEGRLLHTLIEGERLELALEAQETVFNANVVGVPSAHAREWSSGSRLQLTGVYEIEWDERRRPRGFHLYLRSGSDVVVLARPSWLTPGRAIALTGALGGCILIGIGWVVFLRRRVQQQTAQIRAQLAKEANLEARHRDIFQNASDFIFTTDRHGRLTSVNPAGERITGYNREQALQMHLGDLIVSEEETGQLLQNLENGHDGSVSIQSRLRRRDGRVVWTETNARLIRDDHGGAGLLGVVRDISERKQIEEELKRARDAAEANTQAKSVFLANMSHEIRTPMNGVIGMSHLLLDTPLRDDQREFAETIRNSAESLLTVLNDILDFSKIEAGKMHFETVDFDLEETVEDVLDLLGARAAGKGLELAAFVPSEIPRRLRGDPGRLRQVLLNLLGNAVKFTERGEVVVGLDLLEGADGRVKIRFEIRDTGIGLSEEARRRLFQPFTQADSSTTRRFGGTGLGLAISRQIVEMMQGTIGVESEEGRGSTFWFEIWLERQETCSDPGRVASLGVPEGLRVLAVDDHGTNRRLIHFYAAGWEMRCDTVESGSEALDAVEVAHGQGDPYRLVLLDLHMPHMDGLMLAKELMARWGGQAVPMLLLTSIDRRFDPDELEKAGIVSVLHKPLRQRELLRAVLRVADPVQRGGMESAEQRSPTLPGDPKPGPAPLGLRVLVAEDNAVNQRLTQLQLKKLGCECTLAANGLEAIKALEDGGYDAVLMDCQMPEMDGYEATREIRRSGRHVGLRIVAMTANAMEGDREKCLEAGMDDYLSKPTRLDEMRLVLERVVSPDPASASK